MDRPFLNNFVQEQKHRVASNDSYFHNINMKVALSKLMLVETGLSEGTKNQPMNKSEVHSRIRPNLRYSSHVKFMFRCYHQARNQSYTI